MKNYLIIAIAFIVFSCKSINQQGNMTKEHQHTNELIHESSPYLLQHAHNPVNWYPWSEKALEKAKNEDKLLLVSIGYSACHWCHVMEHESFEDETVAQIMNDNFICIKVDREERPDIDHIYMSAVQLISGQGGWPLNCFALPDGKPVWGGTYFQKASWINVMKQIADKYAQNKNEVELHAAELLKGIQQHQLVQIDTAQEKLTNLDHINAVEKWKKNFDLEYGSNKGAPKFPMPVSFEYLLTFLYFNDDDEIKNHIENSLTQIARGGIYDHLGGGFARYSVDEKWLVPHFEKMLYDNAQLISILANANIVSGNPLYEIVIEETIEFLERELKSPDGGYYSALDADSEGIEGKYYVWTKNEVQHILKKDADAFCKYYNITEWGNWEEGKNILHLTEQSEKNKPNELNKLKKLLLKEREKRIPPGLDDKILSSWNALVIIGFLDAYNALGKEEYLLKAEKCLSFLLLKQLNGKVLYRNYKNGKSSISAMLDDYALLIKALIKTYQNTFNEEYISKAEELCSYVCDNFYDKTKGYFAYTNNEKQKITSIYETQDNVIPSANSIMAENLFLLSKYYINSTYEEILGYMLVGMSEQILTYTPYYSNWARLSLLVANKNYELVFTGPQSKFNSTKFLNQYKPNCIVAQAQENSNIDLTQNKYKKADNYIYVCVNKTCKLPVSELNEALKIITNGD